jgi:5-enolpyruvylshikimate-3-phosphate synthase
VTFTLEYPFTSPLRHVLTAFGCEPVIKSNVSSRDVDPLAKRLRFMGVKRREPSGQSYTVTIDCSAPPPTPVEIDLPGDLVLASTLLVAKSVVQRGALLIENVPLESWAAAMINHLRKMGGKPALQQTRQSSYGAAGMVHLQTFTIQGRKADCVPLCQYVDHLPGMVALSCFAKGQTVFRSLDPLRDDRPEPIERMLYCVRTLGGRHGEMPDGMVIDGAQTHDGFDVAEELPASMAGACAAGALRCSGTSTVADESIGRRWPQLGELLESICVYRR